MNTMNLPPDHIAYANECEIVANMEDAVRFLEVTQTDPHSWKWVVYAIFSSVQAGMVLARGTGAIITRKKPAGAWRDTHSVKSFGDLYEELKDDAKWESGVTCPPTIGGSWDQGIRELRGARDDIEHSKFDSTVYPLLMIRSGCLTSLEFFEYLVSRSKRLQTKVGVELPHLRALIARARILIEASKPKP